MLLVTMTVLLFSWQSGYRATTRAYWHAHQQTSQLTGRLAEVEAMVQGQGGEAAWSAQQQQHLTALQTRFPRQGALPQLLNALVDTVKSGNLKLLNVTQGKLEPVRMAEQIVQIGGAPCSRLPVTVNAEGRYHDIVMVVERLTSETFPAAVSVEDVDIGLKTPTGVTLNVTIRASLYVTSGS